MSSRAFFLSITGADIRPLHNSKLHFFSQSGGKKFTISKDWEFVFEIQYLPVKHIKNTEIVLIK
jgi:hypothetical protein